MEPNLERSIKLQRYIDNTTKIRDLSSPSVSDVKNADDYRSFLIQNFTQVGTLAQENNAILKEYYFPLFDSDRPLDQATILDIRDFTNALIDAYQLNFLDIPMVYQQMEQLLAEAEKTGNDRDKILALDGIIPVAYAMMCFTGRLYPVNDICLQFQKTGLSAGERLLTYLDHDIFRTLDDECKELVLINARYIRVVSEVNGVPYREGTNELNLQRMKDALALADDPFYREQLPSYDWDYHIFRTLEYISSFTDENNVRGFDEEAIQYINQCTKRMVDMTQSNRDYYESIHKAQVMEVYLYRNAYLAGESTLDDYKKNLKRVFWAYIVDKTDNTSLSILYAPLEYILVTDPDDLTEDDIHFLRQFYSNAVRFMHQTPKKDTLMFLLYFITIILRRFIEVPGGMNLETMCLAMIAAIHPPTYIHTKSVASFASCIAKHLFRKDPSLFDDVPCIDHTLDLKDREKQLTRYVYHAALCHDFGKLMIAETILTYGRNLLDVEFELIRSHPAAGAHLLSLHPDFAQYADVAHGHHKWANNKGGYPEDFDLDASPYRAVIAIVAIADCMDAATDAVGRSYKQGISLDAFVEELKADSGTRYASFVVDVLDDPSLRSELEELLENGRDENYRETFRLLKQHETVW